MTAKMDLLAKLFLLAPLREGRRCPGARCCPCCFSDFYSRPYARGDAADQRAMLMVTLFLLAPLREGRQQFFTKPQVDLYDKLLKIHIFQINTFCILQHSFENFKDYFVGSARTSRKNVYGKGWR